MLFGDSASPIAGDETINIHFTIVYDVFALLGFLSLSFVLCTALLSSRIHRSTTWFLYIFSWVVYSLGLLLIIGHQGSTKPEFGICLAQAMVIYANPVFVAASTTAYLLQISLHLWGKAPLRHSQILLLVVPSVIFLLVLLEVLIVALLYPSMIEREASGMFCHTAHPLPGRLSACIVIFLFTVSIPIVFTICRVLYRNKNFVRDRLNNENSVYSVSLVLRVVLFHCILLIVLGISLAELLPGRRVNLPALNALLGLLPAMAGLIFGSQRDILRVLMRCPDARGHDEYGKSQSTP
ncbi:hypothetical protein GALMADRAFT_459103 [Galerina marginata CBS 339.88]|uniref:G-protein coupled receptors family 1 profile domain-containing protein n=1 Tax=Galerina marginata (strain CBS 339.88) TaxID=685588 RepID=A0A067T7Z5_GALM3|nr:hypothetical protein GALMADRAFT_459103 [Galerina marginata CBS 339.88]